MTVESAFATVLAGLALTFLFGWWQRAVLIRHLRLDHEAIWEALGKPGPWLSMYWRWTVLDFVWGSDDLPPPPDELSRVLVLRIRKLILVGIGLFVLAVVLRLLSDRLS